MVAPQYSPPPSYAPQMMPMQPQRTGKPVAGGALLLVAGVLAMINFAILIAAGSGFESLFPGLGSILAVCGIIGMIFSILALLGGVLAIMRKMWGLALVGSILGLLTIGPLFVSSILSLVALILIAISREEFQ